MISGITGQISFHAQRVNKYKHYLPQPVYVRTRSGQFTHTKNVPPGAVFAIEDPQTHPKAQLYYMGTHRRTAPIGPF